MTFFKKNSRMGSLEGTTQRKSSEKKWGRKKRPPSENFALRSIDEGQTPWFLRRIKKNDEHWNKRKHIEEVGEETAELF